MSDYGVFEASSTDGHEEEQRQRQAKRDLGRAIEAAREGFGDFLGSSTDKQDYQDRLALVMNDLMQRVADSGVMPVPGVMRKVKAALRPEFRKQAAPGFDPNISDENLLAGLQIAEALNHDGSNQAKVDELRAEVEARGLTPLKTSRLKQADDHLDAPGVDMSQLRLDGLGNYGDAVAVVFDDSGNAVDLALNWETAQSMAQEGYNVQVVRGDGGRSQDEIQRMVDHEKELRRDLFGSRKTASRSLSEIAAEIRADWKNVYFGAEPYLDAMSSLDSIDDSYGQDSAKSIVAYFLSNATSWRGETARRVKKELKELLKRRAHKQAGTVTIYTETLTQEDIDFGASGEVWEDVYDNVDVDEAVDILERHGLTDSGNIDTFYAPDSYMDPYSGNVENVSGAISGFSPEEENQIGGRLRSASRTSSHKTADQWDDEINRSIDEYLDATSTPRIAPHPEYGEGVWSDEGVKQRVLSLNPNLPVPELVDAIMREMGDLYDSIDRELAFWYFSQVTGKDYDDFYNAWLAMPSGKYFSRKTALKWKDTDFNSWVKMDGGAWSLEVDESGGTYWVYFNGGPADGQMEQLSASSMEEAKAEAESIASSKGITASRKQAGSAQVLQKLEDALNDQRSVDVICSNSPDGSFSGEREIPVDEGLQKVRGWVSAGDLVDTAQDGGNFFDFEHRASGENVNFYITQEY